MPGAHHATGRGAAGRPSHGRAIGRRERRKLATHKALLDAGLELIGERGVYETRVEDVTERADVGKGAFYNYFESKAALVAALVVEASSDLERRYVGQKPSSPGLAGRVAAVVDAHEAFFREWPARAILFHQARGLLELSAQPPRALRQAFASYLERLGRHLAGEGEPREQVLEVASLVAGAIAGYRSFTRAAALRTRTAPLKALLTRGLVERRR